MSTQYERAQVLILAKTYPELSRKYAETVCTAGIRDNGRPIRLYPVPLRYLTEEAQYRLYDWIEVLIRKSSRDPRPESYSIDAARKRSSACTYTRKQTSSALPIMKNF